MRPDDDHVSEEGWCPEPWAQTDMSSQTFNPFGISGKTLTWPHLNPIFPYFFIGFLTIIYKKPYKKQRKSHSTEAICHRFLASFKLSYVSPENHKIGKSGWWKWGEKKWSLEAKNGLREFFVWWKLMFWGRSLIWKGQKNNIIAKKGPKMAEKIFWIFVG